MAKETLKKLDESLEKFSKKKLISKEVLEMKSSISKKDMLFK